MLIIPQFKKKLYQVEYMVDLLVLLDTTKTCYPLFIYLMYF